MSDEYKIIKTVELSENVNGQDIKDAFGVVNDNFQRLAGSSITRGQDGVARTHTFKFKDGNGDVKGDFKNWLTTKLGFPEDRAGKIVTSIVSAFVNYPVVVTTTPKWYSNGSYEIYITDDGDVKEALPIIYSNGTGDKKSLTYLQFIYDGNKVLKLGDLNVVLQISEDGYWIVNGVTTSIKAQGEPGKDGKDGPGLDFGFVEVSDEQYSIESTHESLESYLLIKINNQEGYFDNDKKQFISVPDSNFHELNAINIDGVWTPWATYEDKSNWYNTHKDDIFDVIFEEKGQLIIGKGKVELFNGLIPMGSLIIGSLIIGIYCNKIINCVENFHELTRVADSNGDWVTWSMLSKNKQKEWYNINKGRVFLTTNVKPNIEETYMGYISELKLLEAYGMYLTESNIYSPGIGYNDVQGFFDNINYASTNQGTPKGLWLRQPNEGSGAVFFGNSGVGDDRANNLQIFAIGDYNKACNSKLFDDNDKRDVNVNVIGSLNISDQIKLGSILKVDNKGFVFGNLGGSGTVPRVGIYKNDTGSTIAPGIINGERYLQVQGNSGTTTIAPSQITTTNVTTTNAVIGSLNISSQIELGSILRIDKDSFIFGEHSTNVPGSRVGMYKYTNEVENKTLGIINGDKYLQVSRWNIEDGVTKYQTTTITPRQIGTTKIHTHDSLFVGLIDNDGGLKNGFKLDNHDLIFNDVNYEDRKFAVYTASENDISRGININDKYIYIGDNNNLTTITPSQVTTTNLRVNDSAMLNDVLFYTSDTHTLKYAQLLYTLLNNLGIIYEEEKIYKIKEGRYINNYYDLMISFHDTEKYSITNNTFSFSINPITGVPSCWVYRICGKISFRITNSNIFDTIEIDDFVTIVINGSNINLIAPYCMTDQDLQITTSEESESSSSGLNKVPHKISPRGSIKLNPDNYDVYSYTLDSISSLSKNYKLQRIRSFNLMNYNVIICYQIQNMIVESGGDVLDTY